MQKDYLDIKMEQSSTINLKQNTKIKNPNLWILKDTNQEQKRDFKTSIECKTVMWYINLKTPWMGVVPSQ